ncbi:hypothetical protein [uncultured Oscillibacter sp.]|uniref:hypothetical protein n=1 Tax=uncultured Oscillibacter sp. TaxID=876091 RepID=UPI00266F82B3|nr:hypothetical protein [uncultured Oscillibacter sp.]
METMGLTIEQAVAALKVPGGKRQKYGFAGTKETLIPGVGFGISGTDLQILQGYQRKA